MDHPASDYFRLKQLLKDAPELATCLIDTEVRMWLGRAFALVKKVQPFSVDMVQMANLCDSLEDVPLFRAERARKISSILHRTLAIAEESVPAEERGGFIQTGAAFDAFQSVRAVLKEAQSTVHFVDPYLSEVTLTDFAVLANEGVQVCLLGDKERSKPEVLRPALRAWKKQYGGSRPLEIRLTRKGALHDRLILIDQRDIWDVSQSFKDLAVRSPATFSKFSHPDDVSLKLSAYLSAWEKGVPLDTMGDA